MMHQLPVIAGPCVLEEEEIVECIAEKLLVIAQRLPIALTFKASFDKANRSSIHGFRGPGLDEGLKMLERVRQRYGLPLLTDFHTPDQADAVASVVDILQVPAFLSRQTDMIVAGTRAALRYGRRLNIKKGQFLAPWDMAAVLAKVAEVLVQEDSLRSLRDVVMLTERGASFGYNTLVVDMASLPLMQAQGVDVIYDITHSVQLPGAQGHASGGRREVASALARGAIAVGVDGVFLECHPDPIRAKSDAATVLAFDEVETLLEQLTGLWTYLRTKDARLQMLM